MTASELLDHVAALGVELTLKEGEIHFVAPEGVFTDELKKSLRGRKQQVRRLLEEVPANQVEAGSGGMEGRSSNQGGEVESRMCERDVHEAIELVKTAIDGEVLQPGWDEGVRRVRWE